MKNREKTVKLLESFLSDKQVDGVCGYMVDPDGEGPIQVIVVLDIDYIKDANTKPGFVARMIREGVKQEIKKWIGLDVYVGSTAKKCDESESLSESVVYDYIEGRNESPERLPFDVNKLINAGAVFITPAIEGDSSSKNYKKFLKRPYTHLITLHNLKHSSPDSWVQTAVTRFASPKHWEGKDFSKNLYDGKYNQILWSLDELGIPYESMLIDEVNESKKKYIVTESQMKFLLENDKMLWVKRRATKNFMFNFIQKAEMEFPTLCDDFKDELNYASNVIRRAIDDFLTIYEEMFLDDQYDEVSDILTDLCRDWFGNYLFEIYRNTCIEEDNY